MIAHNPVDVCPSCGRPHAPAGLTRRQRDCLLAIQRATDAGVSPSIAELRVALGVVSNSGVHRMVRALTQRGFITRLPYTARSIALQVRI